MILWLVLLAAGCSAPVQVTALPAWEYQDVRLIDPVDTARPEQDLIAAYARQAASELDIRIDLLELGVVPGCDLYLVLDTAQGGRRDLPFGGQADFAWDTLIQIPARGALQVVGASLQPRPGTALRVLRDPIQDNISLRLRMSDPGRPNIALQVFSTSPGSQLLSDQTVPFRLQAAPPAPAPLLLAFWDVFPAYTPATALRRWNGAHTGPLGGGHGLGQLLQAAEQSRVPLVLLDLKDPDVLAGLDYAGGLPQVQRMADAGLLVLPESLPGLPPGKANQVMLYQHIQMDQAFGLNGSRFLFAPDNSLPSGTSQAWVLARWTGPTETSSKAWGAEAQQLPRRTLLPTGASLPSMVLQDGITLEARQALVEAGVAAELQPAEKTSPLLMGGNLPDSTWGVPNLARQGFAYLQAHPWIKILGEPELADMIRAGIEPHLQTASSAQEAAQPDPSQPFQPAIPAEEIQAIDRALLEAPNNALRTAARQAYSALFAPVYPASAKLPALRAAYTGQVWSLLTAAAWAETPANGLDCSHDPDHDHRAECIFADQTVYLQFEAESGSLSYAFLRIPHRKSYEVHQWIGPSSQLITGLSDPASWNPEAGMSADPQAIPGAFFEPGLAYTPTPLSNGWAFSTSGNQVQKHFTWNGKSLQVMYLFASNPPVAAVRIPLLLDPWARFSAGWKNRYRSGSKAGGEVAWRLDPGLQVSMQGQDLRLDTFLDSSESFRRSEDPDRDYPPGHYLPFPLAVVTVPVQAGLNGLSLNLLP